MYEFGGTRSNTLLIAKNQTLWASNSDGRVQEIVKFSLDGKILDRWGTWGANPGQIWGVHAFSTDSEGNLYTAEVYGGRAQKFRPRKGANPARIVGLPYILPARP